MSPPKKDDTNVLDDGFVKRVLGILETQRQLIDNNQNVVNGLETLVKAQQSTLDQMRAQLSGVQDQLGVLTEVATKLAILEERRGEDKATLSEMRTKLDKVHDRMLERFPHYDNLVTMYQDMNRKLWGAIFVAGVGLVLRFVH